MGAAFFASVIALFSALWTSSVTHFSDVGTSFPSADILTSAKAFSASPIFAVRDDLSTSFAFTSISYVPLFPLPSAAVAVITILPAVTPSISTVPFSAFSVNLTEF